MVLCPMVVQLSLVASLSLVSYFEMVDLLLLAVRLEKLLGLMLAALPRCVQ